MEQTEKEKFSKIEPSFSPLNYVLKLDSTTLCHPVFKASLNDTLPKGSSLNKNLLEIVLAQRLFPII